MSSGQGNDERAARPPDPADGPLHLIRELSGEFKSAGVGFCHWKSNAALSLSEAGINDLDLLVDEHVADTARQILRNLGFVRANVSRSRLVPGLTDFFGLDAQSGRLVQVQMHERLVVGDDMTKNFRLPVESAFLESSSMQDVLPTPAPESEYVVFVLRMAVKHCPFDAVVMGKGRLTRTERDELEYLTSRIDCQGLEQVLSEVFPWLAAEDLDRLLVGLAPGSSAYQRARVGRRAMRLLAPFRRRPGPIDLALRIGRRVGRRAKGRPKHGAGRGLKTLSAGSVITLIGGDGSGKSTTVAALVELLSDQFRVAQIHLGKPPRSLTSRVVRRLMRLPLLRGSRNGEVTTDAGSPVLPVLNLLLARDRRRLARRARSLADEGWLVASDRYPVRELTTMDSPRNARLEPAARDRLLARRLIDMENRVYVSIPQPDLRVVMRVSPDVAVSRRPEQARDFVYARAEEVYDLDWAGDVVVDAESPLETVLHDVIGSVWQHVVDNQPERSVS